VWNLVGVIYEMYFYKFALHFAFFISTTALADYCKNLVTPDGSLAFILTTSTIDTNSTTMS